ncbi:GNAT family N-acetyltransferase [Microbacterium sp.]|uniref:GNAT family N-acetyltransferase n=1 Tax=Microbacterium sp. TaxID=51671 RepID=UPI002D77B845|nr:GNAT family N-acetyltransferase [Microbacterium sp.]HET6302550.1 GNAT family N-acetyltransferase [Microbacterium sp.]
MSRTGVTVAITPIPIPANPDAPDAADFRAMVGVRNRVSSALFGEDALDAAPQQVLPTWAEQTDVALHGWLVRAEDEVVGRVVLDMPREPGSRRVMIRVEVVPEAWERGYGRAAMAFAEERASEFGRTVLQAMTVHPAGAEQTLVPRSGAGAMPEDRFARFLLSFGYALEQVYRISTLDLTRPVEGFDALLADAREASAGYRYVSWTSPTPDEWIDDYAWMKARMSTDAPTADMEMDEEAWDAARVRRMEEISVRSGNERLVGAAQHIASGRLVAFTELSSFRVPGKPIDQDDTLVLKEHRGHRLGALVKCETLIRAREQFPEGERIVTGNAEENRPMLAINEAMGFTSTRYIADWQKTV